MKRSPMKRKPKRNPMSNDQREAVFRRDNWTCQAAAYNWPTDKRCGLGLQAHHITGRGLGGTSDPDVHDLDRLVTLCGVHHAEVESRRTDAYACGLAERRNT